MSLPPFTLPEWANPVPPRDGRVQARLVQGLAVALAPLFAALAMLAGVALALGLRMDLGGGFAAAIGLIMVLCLGTLVFLLLSIVVRVEADAAGVRRLGPFHWEFGWGEIRQLRVVEDQRSRHLLLTVTTDRRRRVALLDRAAAPHVLALALAHGVPTAIT